jgi:SAM-dependent methyltransferase
MKITIAQYYTDNLTHGPFAEAINKKYCEEKGYDYFVEKDSTKIRTKLGAKAPTWYKPHLILEVFEKHNSDYVLFLDTDAIISDFNGSIEDFIDENYNLIVANDVSTHSLMNAGVFLIKNNEWSIKFLNDWWDLGQTLKPSQTRNDFVNPLSFEVEGYFMNGLWMDQTILTYMYENIEEYRNKINIISNRSFNWMTYNDNNFIFHAYSYGTHKHRTLDTIYYKIFNIAPPESDETLSEIAIHYNTDKHIDHDYFNLIYDKVLSPLREDITKFVEIGTYNGGSIELWRDYFKNATVYGLDIDFSRVQLRSENRIELINLDQSNKEQLNNFASEHNDIDVILDDGSHKMEDQQITFATLFKSLKPGGIFIIEDLHTSLECSMPEKAWCGWGDPNKTITLDMLNNFIETGKIKSDYMTKEEISYLNKNIKSIEIYQSKPDWSITSIIIKK